MGGYNATMDEKPSKKQLDELEDDIEAVRKDKAVDEAIHGSFYDPDHRFASSGDVRPEEDDQTIAP
jgi:hypothetical protein